MTNTLTKEVLSSTGGHYYVNTDGLTVYKAPTSIIYTDGTISNQFGFLVCECPDYVDNAAAHIAMALNEHERITPPKEPS